MVEYRLHSNGLVYTPGFLEWAKVGMLSDSNKMVEIISKGYGLSQNVAYSLLSGHIDYRVEDETVIFEAEE